MREIPLTQGLVAIVDDTDYDQLAEFSWCAVFPKGKVYACRSVKRNKKTKFYLMHREILGISDPKIEVDHKNGDGLRNLRSNLRVATRVENSRNRPRDVNNISGFKGVSPMKSGKWLAQLTASERPTRHIGCFETAEKAARAYDAEAKKYFGEFARLNFPERDISTTYKL